MLFIHKREKSEKMNRLKNLVENLRKIGYESDCFFATIEFIKKENICYHIQNVIGAEFIINGEDILIIRF